MASAAALPQHLSTFRIFPPPLYTAVRNEWFAKRSVTMPHDRIIAVGLLTERDLRVLGEGFNRVFAVEDVKDFDNLLARLDHIEATSPTRSRHDARKS